MDYLITILSLLVFFLFSLVDTIYWKNKSFFIRQYDISNTSRFLLVMIHVSVFLYIIYCFYSMLIYSSHLNYGNLIALIIPKIMLVGYRGVDGVIATWIKREVATIKSRAYKVCPFCHSSHIFYRYTYKIADDDESKCYLLVNKFYQQVLLGYLYNKNHLALAFIENEDFIESLSRYKGLLVESYDDALLIEGNIYELEDKLYCQNCNCLVTSEPLDHGVVSFVQPINIKEN